MNLQLLAEIDGTYAKRNKKEKIYLTEYLPSLEINGSPALLNLTLFFYKNTENIRLTVPCWIWESEVEDLYFISEDHDYRKMHQYENYNDITEWLYASDILYKCIYSKLNDKEAIDYYLKLGFNIDDIDYQADALILCDYYHKGHYLCKEKSIFKEFTLKYPLYMTI